jgi:hypothetical protein
MARSMSQPPKQPAPAGKQRSWAIYRLKGIPAKLLGNVDKGAR